MRIRNDYLHSWFVGAVSLFLSGRRDTIEGDWNGEKCICLSFDCDFQEDMNACTRLVDFLASSEIAASFAIPWFLAEAFPAVIENILEDGQEIVNHTLTHTSNFRNLAIDHIRREIENYQGLMRETYHYLPKGFRCPHGMRQRNDALFEILKKNKMYDSSLVGQAVTNINGVWEISITSCPEHPSMAYDTYHHFRFPLFSSSEQKMLKLWNLLLQETTFINVFFDPLDLVSPARQSMFKNMIDSAEEQGFAFLQMQQIYDMINSS
jgi:peptidoglycan/xylan/chitin deacetylase (PgdA/CDA1 family)